MGNVLRHGFGKSSLGDEETLWLSLGHIFVEKTNGCLSSIFLVSSDIDNVTDTMFTQPVNKHNYVKIFKCSDYDKLNPEFEQTPSHRF